MPTKKKQLKYCDLTHAIRDYDAEFYAALDGLCILPLLRSGRNGVTFLFPENKAVRKKIIDARYSKNPEVAVKTVKALILRGCYKQLADLSRPGNIVSNNLNKIVEVKEAAGKYKWGDFTITVPKDFETFDYRNNISLLILEGNHNISISGADAPRVEFNERVPPNRGTVVGGGPSHRVLLSNKIARHYKSEYSSKKSNAYVKKVYFQLRILEDKYPQIYSRVVDHLGNDEISDSYLLDMITPEDVLCELWKGAGQNSEGLGELSDDLVDGKVHFHTKYIELKTKIIEKKYTNEQIAAKLKKNFDEQTKHLKEVVSACDFREYLVNAYQNSGGKTRLGKDLFIVYTSIMKEMWMHERDMASFDHYSYMATNIYTSPDDMVDQEFNQFKDATLHGNLLKSDVFKFIPCTNVGVYTSVYTKTDMPRPVDLTIYSLNAVVNGLMNEVSGGASSILGKYL